MKALEVERVFDIQKTNHASVEIGSQVTHALESGLSSLGFEFIPEDSIGVLAVRVVDTCSVGTAYLEFRDGQLNVRVVLQDDRGKSNSDSGRNAA